MARLTLVFATLILTVVSWAIFANATTNPTDLAIFNQLITNNPAWGTLRGWQVGNDPCTGADGYTQATGIWCNSTYGDDLLILNINLAMVGYPHALKLAGPIPQELGLFPNLQILNLRWNNLTGNIPEMVSPYLYSIDLSYNFLEGPIPASFSTLSELTYLSLAHNQLSGPLPASMAGAPWKLEFYQNQFTGSLNIQVNKTNLQRINAGYNQLSGSIAPDYFDDALVLTDLLLSHNNLSGILPASLAAVSTLSYLDLSFNDFSGTLPELSTAMLSSFVVTNNRFSGPIPQFFVNQPYLTTVVLSCNSFSGAIPNYLSTLPNLQYLRLEVNQLGGQLPSFLQHPPEIIIGNPSHPTQEISINFNATCNNFESPLPNWCSLSGSNLTCVPCEASQRVCLSNFMVVNPIVRSPSPSPSPLPDTSSGVALESYWIKSLRNLY